MSTIQNVKLKVILFAVSIVLRKAISKYELVRKHVGSARYVIQVKLRDNSIARYYDISLAGVQSKAGLHPAPDLILDMKDVETALIFLNPNPDRAEIIHAMKNFRVLPMGPDHVATWFSMLMNLTNTVKMKFGTEMPDGTMRFTTNTNGGPLFVYVKDDKIVRMTPIDFDANDAPGWTIKARNKSFTPSRRTSINPHAQCLKSLVYSEKRILYPMKRVDFDPNGERNRQNRGKSEYVRISWDEAFGMVANEIKRQRQVYGPGAMTLWHGSHHQWGNVGYYLSCLLRFGNLVGFTRVLHNPDSWEGWYWGAMHHFGNSMRVGIPGFYGLVEDCLKEAEMIVFWSSDPESTSGYASGFEGTQRRFWAKELGIDFVHIDPNLNPTAQLFGGRWVPIKPGTDPALAIAIMHVWINEGLYDKTYVETRTTGFDEWKDYILGKDDGVPKTPEWQEEETGVPAQVVRALARAWGKKKTYLAAGGLGAGFGGACRNSTGTQWARNMILLMAMQGLGKPGINFGNLQAGTPLDHNFWFPGYAEGGISGELNFTAGAPHTYCRMPHILTINPVKQVVPRQRLPDAIVNGHAKGFPWDGFSQEAQFGAYEYPTPGYSKIHMIYRYGTSTFGTISNTSRYVDMFRHESIDMVVHQCIWMEGDAAFSDLILPACTSFERYDISDWGNSGGYIHHNTDQLNHRMVMFQHKCIEPLGESKSDYSIFLGILERMGTGAMYSEGCSELEWAKRMFDASDASKGISWAEFIKKGYYLVPPEREQLRSPAYFRWFAEDRHKDVPEPLPLPAQWSGDFLKGLSTQSGKIEFVPSSIKRGDPGNSERQAVNRYVPSWEGPRTTDLIGKYPVQMISTHSRYSFHTYGDGKDSTLNDIDDHRVNVDGYYYWVMRINDDDAAARGIKHHDLIRVYNDRGSVVCAADVSPLIKQGVCKSYESSAEFDYYDDPRFGPVDLGGCVNTLTPERVQVKNTDGMGSNSCLVEFETWVPPTQALKRA
jgi:molybdopterin guanine dinucleotide-containing S/N-oxide reductase-like protein